MMDKTEYVGIPKFIPRPDFKGNDGFRMKQSMSLCYFIESIPFHGGHIVDLLSR